MRTHANLHLNIDVNTTNVDFFFLLWYTVKIIIPHIFTSHASTSHKDLHCQSSRHAWRSRHDRLTGCHVWRPNVPAANDAVCAPVHTPYPDRATEHTHIHTKIHNAHPCLLEACWPGGVRVAQSWAQVPTKLLCPENISLVEIQQWLENIP